jgi:hypothetical protein
MAKVFVINHQAEDENHPVTKLSEALANNCKPDYLADRPETLDETLVTFVHVRYQDEWVAEFGRASENRIVIVCSSNDEHARGVKSQWAPDNPNVWALEMDVETFIEQRLASFWESVSRGSPEKKLLTKRLLPENVIAAYLLEHASMADDPAVTDILEAAKQETGGLSNGEFLDVWFKDR